MDPTWFIYIYILFSSPVGAQPMNIFVNVSGLSL